MVTDKTFIVKRRERKLLGVFESAHEELDGMISIG